MTQFAPGQSGNPGGRPKGTAEVRELARKHTEAAIKKLAAIMSIAAAAAKSGGDSEPDGSSS